MRSKVNSRPSVQPNEQMPLLQRRLKTKPTLILLALLFLGNVFWFILWLIPNNDEQKGGNEQVAAVNETIITRQQWMATMEERYGKETLRNLVNEAVMEEAASKYDIKVTDKEIDFEIALLRSAQDANDTSIESLSDEQLRAKIRNQLILEKVLSKDLIVEDEAVQKYYNENKSLYNISTTYRTKLIVVETLEEAKAVKDEVKKGSDFSVLAREKSLDAISASLGGSIGFIYEGQESIDPAISTVVSKTKENETSDPFGMSDGKYGIVLVEEIMKGKSFTYNEAKDHIKRSLAMQQLPSSINAETFWGEFKAEWIYESKN